MGLGRGPAGGILATEICVPILLLCWLCCWPDDSKSGICIDYPVKISCRGWKITVGTMVVEDARRRNKYNIFGPLPFKDSSTGRHPRKPVVVDEGGTRRRSSEFFGRRMGSSAVSLHLPSTSGHKKPLSAHRSHEDIGRRKSHNGGTEETRYHSAPSVIDEVIHRRDWERSNRELYIPLNPQRDSNISEDVDKEEEEVKAPHAVPESSSIDSKEEVKPCKKHYTNIKSSKPKKNKESTRDDIKDADATETTEFYIGDTEDVTSIKDNSDLKFAKDFVNEVQTKTFYKAKEAKQTFNESIRSKEKPKQTLVPLDEHQPRMFGFCLDDVIEQLESLDRSGAMHHSIESRISISRPFYPPPSVETIGYDGGACYLAEVGSVSELRGRVADPEGVVRSNGTIGAMRSRHMSDGDILAPPHRPESGAFSESDLDLDLEGGEEIPPAYDEVQHFFSSDRKETAI